jgi:hypothetical protein
MIGLTADAGEHFKNRATIPLAPCRFSLDTLGYGFLFGNHKHLATVSRLLVCGFFFLRFLKSIGSYRFSYGFLVVLNVFHYGSVLFKVINNLKFSKRYFIKDEI